MSQKTSIAVVIAIVVVFTLVGGSGLITNIFSVEKQNTNKQTQVDNNENTPAPAQVQVKDVAVGTGAEAVVGKTVTVHYTGVFADGKKFDSSRDRGTPFSFTLGAGMVIKGWDIGVQGMKVGGKRILVVPPELGYGAKDYGPIPGNSILIFEVELLGVK